MNIVILQGTLIKDAEVITNNGSFASKFVVAVSRDYKSNGVDTDFITCIYWTREDKISKYLKKGIKVTVQGAMENVSFTTREGTKRIVTQVKVKEVRLERETQKEKEEKSVGPNVSYEDADNLIPLDDDPDLGLPF